MCWAHGDAASASQPISSSCHRVTQLQNKRTGGVLLETVHFRELHVLYFILFVAEYTRSDPGAQQWPLTCQGRGRNLNGPLATRANALPQS